MNDSEASGRARARWHLLFKTLKGCPSDELNSDENSTRSFPGYKLFSITKSTRNNTDKTVSWLSYSLHNYHPASIQVVCSRTQAKDLVGFDNTGNVCVWPSEEVLAYYCTHNAHLFAGKTVCELGCGMTGLAGVFTAVNTACQKMVLTDGNEKSMENLSSIVAENSFGDTEVDSAVLRWGEEVSAFTHKHGTFDVVICADCLFFVNVQDQLIETIKTILNPDGVCIIFAPRRGKTLDRFVGLAEKVFEVEIEKDADDYVSKLHRESLPNGHYNPDLHFPILVRLSHLRQCEN